MTTQEFQQQVILDSLRRGDTVETAVQNAKAAVKAVK